MKEAFSMPIQGWDAVRILSQIASFQTLHYLILATLLPPFLAIFAETSSLMFEGGPTQVGMVFDWRQIAGKPTYDWNPLSITASTGGGKDWTNSLVDNPQDQSGSGKGGSEEVVIDPSILVDWNLDNVWLDLPLNGGKQTQDKVLDHERILRFKHASNSSSRNTTAKSDVDPTSPSSEINPAKGSETLQEALQHWEFSHSSDSHRSYVLIFTWLLLLPLDIILLVYLVRRPTHILDHALTFHLLNLVITTLYTGSVPRGLKWWLTMLFHAGVMVVWSEQLAIKRELGRSVGYNLVGSGEGDVEVGGAGKASRKEVVFDSEAEIRGERIEMRPL